jgi:hypothetical protein
MAIRARAIVLVAPDMFALPDILFGAVVPLGIPVRGIVYLVWRSLYIAHPAATHSKEEAKKCKQNK